MTSTARAFLRLMRPHQWTKNAFVLAGLAFGQERLADGTLRHVVRGYDPLAVVGRALLAAAVFSLLSAVVYVFNDIRDVEQDRLHPTKRLRPIAAGLISPVVAGIAGSVLLGIALSAAAWLSPATLAVALVYLGINALYTEWWKHVVILDIFCVASGFVLRVVAGVVAVEAIVRPWILACTMFLALLISLGKRRSEVFLLGEGAGDHRRILGEYPLPFLDVLIVATSTMTVIGYALFTVEGNRSPFLIATVPFVVYGVFRYLFLLYVVHATEPPDVLILRDRPMLVNGILWGLLSAFIFAVY